MILVHKRILTAKCINKWCSNSSCEDGEGDERLYCGDCNIRSTQKMIENMRITSYSYDYHVKPGKRQKPKEIDKQILIKKCRQKWERNLEN